MKKIFLLSFLMFAMFSCSPDNDLNTTSLVPLPIESVVVPDSFQFGEVFPIEVTYSRPSTCHIFNTFFVENVANETTVIVINTVFDEPECETLSGENSVAQATFNYQVNDLETQVFKFWQGKDDNDNDLYLIVEIPVEQ